MSFLTTTHSMVSNTKLQYWEKTIFSLSQAISQNSTVLRQLETKALVLEIIEALDQGQIRVTPPPLWNTQTWIKQAILFYFQIMPITPLQSGCLSFQDKIPLKTFSPSDSIRIVPPATVRKGAFICAGCILMPSFVNIGAYIDSGTMIDTWATVGSCAQIGKNVHLSGGVGIGGVLEPLQAQPVVIEDDVFIGSRSVVVEGVHIGRGAVLGAGVTLTASTKIIDVTTDPPTYYEKRIPSWKVVIPGTRSKSFPAGTFSVPCALIIGTRTKKTDRKTALNQCLRDFTSF